jgi:hypothetical protein
MADCFEHPLHLVVAALVDRQLDAVAAEEPGFRRRGDAVVELDAGAQQLHYVLGGLAFNLGDVRLLDAVLRVRERPRERAVVREQECTRRVDVEAGDRDDTGRGHDVDDRTACGRCRRHVTDGLVQQNHASCRAAIASLGISTRSVSETTVFWLGSLLPTRDPP